MQCVYCRRPLCENFVTGDLMTGDSDRRCLRSIDGRHHLECIDPPESVSVDIYIRSITNAEHRKLRQAIEWAQEEGHVTRIMQGGKCIAVIAPPD